MQLALSGDAARSPHRGDGYNPAETTTRAAVVSSVVIGSLAGVDKPFAPFLPAVGRIAHGIAILKCTAADGYRSGRVRDYRR